MGKGVYDYHIPNVNTPGYDRAKYEALLKYDRLYDEDIVNQVIAESKLKYDALYAFNQLKWREEVISGSMNRFSVDTALNDKYGLPVDSLSMVMYCNDPLLPGSDNSILYLKNAIMLDDTSYTENEYNEKLKKDYATNPLDLLCFDNTEFVKRIGYYKVFSFMDIINDDALFERDYFFFVNDKMLQDAKIVFTTNTFIIFIPINNARSNHEYQKTDVQYMLESDGLDEWRIVSYTKSAVMHGTKPLAEMVKSKGTGDATEYRVYFRDIQTKKNINTVKNNIWTAFVSTYSPHYGVRECFTLKRKRDGLDEYLEIPKELYAICSRSMEKFSIIAINNSNVTNLSVLSVPKDSNISFDSLSVKLDSIYNNKQAVSCKVWIYDPLSSKKIAQLPLVNNLDVSANMSLSKLSKLLTLYKYYVGKNPTLSAEVKAELATALKKIFNDMDDATADRAVNNPTGISDLFNTSRDMLPRRSYLTMHSGDFKINLYHAISALTQMYLVDKDEVNTIIDSQLLFIIFDNLKDALPINFLIETIENTDGVSGVDSYWDSYEYLMNDGIGKETKRTITNTIYPNIHTNTDFESIKTKILNSPNMANIVRRQKDSAALNKFGNTYHPYYDSILQFYYVTNRNPHRFLCAFNNGMRDTPYAEYDSEKVANLALLQKIFTNNPKTYYRYLELFREKYKRWESKVLEVSKHPEIFNTVMNNNSAHAKDIESTLINFSEPHIAIRIDYLTPDVKRYVMVFIDGLRVLPTYTMSVSTNFYIYIPKSKVANAKIVELMINKFITGKSEIIAVKNQSDTPGSVIELERKPTVPIRNLVGITAFGELVGPPEKTDNNTHCICGINGGAKRQIKLNTSSGVVNGYINSPLLIAYDTDSEQIVDNSTREYTISGNIAFKKSKDRHVFRPRWLSFSDDISTEEYTVLKKIDASNNTKVLRLKDAHNVRQLKQLESYSYDLDVHDILPHYSSSQITMFIDGKFTAYSQSLTDITYFGGVNGIQDPKYYRNFKFDGGTIRDAISEGSTIILEASSAGVFDGISNDYRVDMAFKFRHVAHNNEAYGVHVYDISGILSDADIIDACEYTEMYIYTNSGKKIPSNMVYKANHSQWFVVVMKNEEYYHYFDNGTTLCVIASMGKFAHDKDRVYNNWWEANITNYSESVINLWKKYHRSAAVPRKCCENIMDALSETSHLKKYGNDNTLQPIDIAKCEEHIKKIIIDEVLSKL